MQLNCRFPVPKMMVNLSRSILGASWLYPLQVREQYRL